MIEIKHQSTGAVLHAEARLYWAGKENRREVLAALDYIEAVARIRGWATEGSAM